MNVQQKPSCIDSEVCRSLDITARIRLLRAVFFASLPLGVLIEVKCIIMLMVLLSWPWLYADGHAAAPWALNAMLHCLIKTYAEKDAPPSLE
eukprot:scaffold230365_cov20-Prasinocladus_malaysianus.AAC.1